MSAGSPSPRPTDAGSGRAGHGPTSGTQRRPLAIASGASVKAVQRMLGHASAAMTLDVGSGLFEDDLDGLADRMDESSARAAADFLRTGR